VLVSAILLILFGDRKGIWSQLLLLPHASSGVVTLRIDPLCFLAGCCKRRLNQAVSMVLVQFCHCAVAYYGSFLCFVSFCLFLLSCQYLPSDWLERLLSGSLTVARGSSPQSPGRRVLMIFCFVVLWCIFLFPWPYIIHFILLWSDIACFCWNWR